MGLIGVARAIELPPSAVALIVANLVPLAGVVLLGWDVGDLMVVFWLENVIIGGFNVLKILTNRPGDLRTWFGKAVLVPFFVVHYGGFTFVHGVFVFALFAGSDVAENPFDLSVTAGWIVERQLWFGIAALILSHGFSFAWNYLRGGEYKTLDIGSLMMRPYGRVAVLHLTILLGALPTLFLGSPLGALLLLVIVKVVVDLLAHVKEHATAPAT